jgi:flagellar hook-length control protein FliK
LKYLSFSNLTGWPDDCKTLGNQFRKGVLPVSSVASEASSVASAPRAYQAPSQVQSQTQVPNSPGPTSSFDMLLDATTPPDAPPAPQPTPPAAPATQANGPQNNAAPANSTQSARQQGSQSANDSSKAANAPDNQTDGNNASSSADTGNGKAADASSTQAAATHTSGDTTPTTGKTSGKKSDADATGAIAVAVANQTPTTPVAVAVQPTAAIAQTPSTGGKSGDGGAILPGGITDPSGANIADVLNGAGSAGAAGGSVDANGKPGAGSGTNNIGTGTGLGNDALSSQIAWTAIPAPRPGGTTSPSSPPPGATGNNTAQSPKSTGKPAAPNIAGAETSVAGTGQAHATTTSTNPDLSNSANVAVVPSTDHPSDKSAVDAALAADLGANGNQPAALPTGSDPSLVINSAPLAQAVNPTAAALSTPQTITAPAVAVPISGLAVEIAARAQTGKNSFEIRLDPPELGRIDVKLDVDRSGNVTSRLVVDKPETLNLLRDSAPQLQRALEDAGLKTGDNGLQFSLRDQNPGGQNQNQNAGNSANSNSARIVIPDEDSAPVAAVRGYGRLISPSGGVDIRV